MSASIEPDSHAVNARPWRKTPRVTGTCQTWRLEVASKRLRWSRSSVAPCDRANGTRTLRRLARVGPSVLAQSVPASIGVELDPTENARSRAHAGAKRVFALVRHGVFSPDARQLFEPGRLDGLLVTDSAAPFSLPAGPQEGSRCSAAGGCSAGPSHTFIVADRSTACSIRGDDAARPP